MNTTTVWRRLAAVCMAGAAAVHLGVAGVHFQEWWGFGVFFVAVAAFQVIWSVRAWQPVGRSWLLAGILGNVAILLVWAATRMVGLPLGPDAGVVEPLGAADLISGLFEAVSVVLAGVVLRHRDDRLPARQLSGRTALVATVATAGLVLVGSGVAIATPGGRHEHDAQATAGQTAATGEAHRPDHGDGGKGTGNGERHAMADLPDVSKATAEQTKAAADLLARTKAATAAYRDPAAATKAGFDIEAALARNARKHPGAKGKQIKALHVASKANRADGKVVDPTAPERLIYHRSAEGKLVLIGVMFTAKDKQPPAVFEPYLRWHYHGRCAGKGQQKTPVGTDGCADGTKAVNSAYMTHVWFVPSGDLVQAFAMAAPKEQLQAYQDSLT